MNQKPQKRKCTGLISSVWKQLPGYLYSQGCLCPANAHLLFQNNELESATTLRNQVYLDVLNSLLPFSSASAAEPLERKCFHTKKCQLSPSPYHISHVCFTASYVNESVQTSFLILFSVLPGSFCAKMYNAHLKISPQIHSTNVVTNRSVIPTSDILRLLRNWKDKGLWTSFVMFYPPPTAIL